MAIVIPSKHIYDKDNNKIRDNKIDRIEVHATEIVPNNEYETPVYNGTFENIFSIGVNQNDTEIKVDGYGYIAYISYVEAIPKYGNIENLDVPILKNNHYIEKLLLWKDKNENTNINISFIGNIYKGKAMQQRTSSTSSGTNVQEVVYQEPTYKENGVRYELPELTISNTVDSGNGLYVATASVNINNETNLVNLTAKKITIQNIEYFRLENLKILCGLKFAKIGKILSFTNPDNWGSYTLEGEYEEYIPTQIEITIYGNTIGIDLKNKTVYIPDESGNKPFSVEGNELMQTSNYYTLKKVDDKDLISPTSYWVGKSNYNNYAYYTSVHIDGEKNSWETYVDYKDTKDGVIKTVIIPPRQNTHSPALETTGTDTIEIIKVYNKNSICSQFQDTLLEYSNGKETATILCDIYHYDVDVKVKVLDYELLDDGSVFCRLKADNINDIYDFFNIEYIYVNGVEGFIRDIDEDEFLLIVYFNDASIIEYLEENEITINKKSYFNFNIGDVVIPMVYGANGVDKPMSKYKDGTPKKFKVLGTRIFYDGAVWQELTLQETLE